MNSRVNLRSVLPRIGLRTGAWLTGAAIVVVGMSCGQSEDSTLSARGGRGTVVVVDGAADDGGGDGQGDASDGSATGGRGGRGGSNIGLGGGTAARGGAGAGGVGTAGGAGGGAGSGPPDDPCTACEKARCSHPAGYRDPLDNYAQMIGAWGVCFGGGQWPTAEADPRGFCGPPSDWAFSTATNGPRNGDSKADICQALLKCMHRSQCADPNLSGTDCYCGAGVELSLCISPQFTPNGACKDEMLAALETDNFAASLGKASDPCFANGAALTIVGTCDYFCCSQECRGKPPDYDLPDLCNAPTGAAGTSGAAGSGTGAAGTTGAAGSGGRGGNAGSSAGSTGAAGAAAAAAGPPERRGRSCRTPAST